MSFKAPPNPNQSHSVITLSCDHLRAKVSLQAAGALQSHPGAGQELEPQVLPGGRAIPPL